MTGQVARNTEASAERTIPGLSRGASKTGFSGKSVVETFPVSLSLEAAKLASAQSGYCLPSLAPTSTFRCGMKYNAVDRNTTERSSSSSPKGVREPASRLPSRSPRASPWGSEATPSRSSSPAYGETETSSNGVLTLQPSPPTSSQCSERTPVRRHTPVMGSSTNGCSANEEQSLAHLLGTSFVPVTDSLRSPRSFRSPAAPASPRDPPPPWRLMKLTPALTPSDATHVQSSPAVGATAAIRSPIKNTGEISESSTPNTPATVLQEPCTALAAATNLRTSFSEDHLKHLRTSLAPIKIDASLVQPDETPQASRELRSRRSEMAAEPSETDVVEAPILEQAAQLPGDDYGDSSAWKAVHMAAKLGLRICGTSLSSLLVNQIAMEFETARVVSAYQVLARSREALSSSSLRLVMRLKEMPPMLDHVLESVMVLIAPGMRELQQVSSTNARLDTSATSVPSGTSLVRAGSSPLLRSSMQSTPAPGLWRELSPAVDMPRPGLWRELSPVDMLFLLESIDIDKISASQLEQLWPALNSLSHDSIRESFGIAAYLWTWVCAICVIAGSRVAMLPSEEPAAVKAKRASYKCSVPPQPIARTCQGAPITGRPSYDKTPTADGACPPSRITVAKGCSPTSSPGSSQASSPAGSPASNGSTRSLLWTRSPTSASCTISSSADSAVISGRHGYTRSSAKMLANPLPMVPSCSLASTAASPASAADTISRPPRIETRRPVALATITVRYDETTDAAAVVAAVCGEQQTSQMTTDLSLPTEALNDLEPLKFLGAGAFANVFMCRHKATNTHLALKCILKSVAVKKNKVHQVRCPAMSNSHHRSPTLSSSSTSHVSTCDLAGAR